MLKPVSLVTVLTLVFFTACQKDAGDNPGNPDNSGTYLPLTKDTYWRYSNSGDVTTDTSTITILGIQNNFDGITYEAALNETSSSADTIYYAVNNHNYYLRAGFEGNDVTVLMLNDSLPVNGQWSAPVTISGISATGTGKIVEKGISLTVNGKNYADVIHSNYSIDTQIFGTTLNVGSFDFYFAKNIGPVKIDSKMTADGTSYSSDNLDIIDYSIK